MDRKAARCTPHRHYPLSLYTLAMFPRLPAYAAVPSRPRRHDCAGSQSGTTSRTVGPLVVIWNYVARSSVLWYNIPRILPTSVIH